MAKPRFDILAAPISALCRRHRIKRLALFGSAPRDDLTLDSDVDLLVEFEPNAAVGLERFAIGNELRVGTELERI